MASRRRIKINSVILVDLMLGKLYITLVLLCMWPVFGLCQTQDSSLIHFIVERIAARQTRDDDFFLTGIFPSYIAGKEKFTDKRADNNIFFNGLIAYTLKEIKPYLDVKDRSMMDSVLECAKPLFAKFKNRNGRPTYNFWRTDSSYDYPYAGVFRLLAKKITLPDDFDDTVLSLAALDASDSTAQKVHALMQHYINADTSRVRSVLRAYDTFPAYSTWFGKNFPVVFDVSVLCNVLSFVQAYDLPWTKADSASLKVILTTITGNYHITSPVYVSPYYPKTSLILYHVARLMSIKKIPELEQLKVKLVKDAVTAFAGSDNLMEKIILSTAILKWGYMPPPVVLPGKAEVESKVEENDFSFFVGNIPSYMHDIFRRYATGKSLGFFYHYCPAYNDLLLLEYLVWKDK